MKQPVIVDHLEKTIDVPHLGVTMRVMMGAVVSTWGNPPKNEKRKYKIRYKNSDIGILNVKQH